MIFNSKIRFKPSELQNLNWLYNLAPCFPMNSSKIKILSDPKQFYLSLCENVNCATKRISVASLYIGTGVLEKKLLDNTKANMISNKNLKLTVLLDYQRGTRGEPNSKTMLQDILDSKPDNSNVYFYQTPRIQGYYSKLLPSRYNEVIGLQHMKLYIVDNLVLISGANCSNDYFQQRQDRYMQIEDSNLADFYCELIDAVNKISKKCTQDGFVDPVKQTNNAICENINNIICNWMDKQSSLANDETADTWVFPLIQMGEFNIAQDEIATQTILNSAPENSTINIATGYFNLTDNYTNTLLRKCKAHISMLMAHPNANGFLGASGPAGGIPHAYSLIAKKFWQKVVDLRQQSRVEMLEYERPGWTFHAKGIWYYPPGSRLPWATMVGSANLGERSVRRDLEAQAAIVTTSTDLQKRLHDEYQTLRKEATECSKQLQQRQIPVWVHATVGLFKSYF